MVALANNRISAEQLARWEPEIDRAALNSIATRVGTDQGISPVYWLINALANNRISAEQLARWEAKIDRTTLNSIVTGVGSAQEKSPVYFLMAALAQNYISAEQFARWEAKIDRDALNTVVTEVGSLQGKSAVYHLVHAFSLGHLPIIQFTRLIPQITLASLEATGSYDPDKGKSPVDILLAVPPERLAIVLDAINKMDTDTPLRQLLIKKGILHPSEESKATESATAEFTGESQKESKAELTSSSSSTHLSPFFYSQPSATTNQSTKKRIQPADGKVEQESKQKHARTLPESTLPDSVSAESQAEHVSASAGSTSASSSSSAPLRSSGLSLLRSQPASSSPGFTPIAKTEP